MFKRVKGDFRSVIIRGRGEFEKKKSRPHFIVL